MERPRSSVREIGVRQVDRFEPPQNVGLELCVGQGCVESLQRDTRFLAAELAKQGQLWCLMRPLAQHDLDQVSIRPQHGGVVGLRSEESRVGKECRYGSWRD